jgi:hypothetical protein
MEQPGTRVICLERDNKIASCWDKRYIASWRVVPFEFDFSCVEIGEVCSLGKQCKVVAVKMQLYFFRKRLFIKSELTYWMSHRGEYSVGFVNKGSWGRRDGDVDPFILLGVWNNEINSVVRIPRIIVQIQYSGVREVQPQWVLSKRPPLEAVALFWSVVVLLQADVKLGLVIYIKLAEPGLSCRYQRHSQFSSTGLTFQGKIGFSIV